MHETRPNSGYRLLAERVVPGSSTLRKIRLGFLVGLVLAGAWIVAADRRLSSAKPATSRQDAVAGGLPTPTGRLPGASQNAAPNGPWLGMKNSAHRADAAAPQGPLVATGIVMGRQSVRPIRPPSADVLLATDAAFTIVLQAPEHLRFYPSDFDD